MVFRELNLIFNVCAAFLKAFIRCIWPPSEKSIEGEVVLVTGAGHGMGRLWAQKFSSLGSKVIVVDINEEGNLETAKMIKETGAVVHSYTCNLRSQDQIKSLAKKIKIGVGDVTILVNNAGVVFCADILSLTDEMISTTFDVNILAHFWLIREFLPNMKKKNHGHIFAMGSYASRYGTPYFTDYSATKHAVQGLMDGLRRELRWQGVTGVKVTTAFPTFVTTGFVKNPRTRSPLLMPVFEPEPVVNAAMHALLTDQSDVVIPSSATEPFARAIFPAEAIELIYDYIDARVDLIKPDKGD